MKTDERERTRPATLAEVRGKLREALCYLEQARVMMVHLDERSVFDSEDVHAVALAQFAVGQLVESMSPEARSRAAVKRAKRARR